MAITKTPKCLSTIFVVLTIFAIFTHATLANIPLGSVSDLLIQSALDSLNENSPNHNTYKSGNLISAQKLLEPPYVVYKLTLNLEPKCSDGSSCPREACAIDLRQHELGTIDVQTNSIQCMYLYPHSDQADTQQQTIQDGAQDNSNTQEQDTRESFDKRTDESSVQLDHEIQTVTDGIDRPFIAVRAIDRNYCAGCPYELNPELPGLAAYGEQVIRSMDESGRSDFKHKIVRVVRVTRAVPPGSNVVLYELLLEIGETNCLKVGISSRADCLLLPNVPTKYCLVTFEQRPWQQDSRKIVRNNCTDLPDSLNEVTGNLAEASDTTDALYAGATSPKDNAESNMRNENNGETLEHNGRDEKLGSTSYSSSIDEFFDSFETTTGGSIRQEDPRLPVTEKPSTKISREGDMGEIKVEAFKDKYKEFDDFLKEINFNAPVKNRHPEPVDDRKPVNEEIIRPVIVVRTNSDSSPNVSGSDDERNNDARTKRSISDANEDEKEFVVKLAQKVVDELDEIDADDEKRILLEVKNSKKQPSDDTTYFIEMRVAKSNCLEGTTDCSDDTRGPAKICVAQIQTQKLRSLETSKVLQSQCYDELKKRDGRSRRQLLGGPAKRTIDDEEIRNYAEKALRKFSKTYEGDNEPFLVEIVEAETQVVSGLKHRIKVRFGESTCLKGEKVNCRLRSDREINDYLITVWSQPWKDNGNPDISIEQIRENRNKSNLLRVRRSEQIPGGITPTVTDDPEIQKYAKLGLTKYTDIFKADNEPYLIDIIDSSKQVVSGMLYKIKVRVGESTCPKGVKKNCQLKSDGDAKVYEIRVWSQPWVDHGNPDIKIELYSEKERVAKRSLRGKYYSEKMHKLGKTLEDERNFDNFVNEHHKTYDTAEERDYRFGVFRDNMRMVEKLRDKEQGTAVYGATFFADLTPSEFRAKHLGLRQDLRSENDLPLPMAVIPNIELPREFDWRHRNVVTEVKNQGSCGSCWAFSVTGNVESLNAIKHGILLSLSEQELVDCDKLDSGCEGGLPDNAYRAIEQIGGLELETDYPYDGEDEKCHFEKTKARVNVVSGLNITTNETQMAQWLVQNGPISIGINANAMQFYMGGISHPFKFLCNADNLDHGVLIVGYGIHKYPIFKKEMPYWIIKNSWGPRWGEQGYYRVYRGDGTCGVNRMATSAVIA